MCIDNNRLPMLFILAIILVFVMGMLIRYDDPRNLSESSSVTVSPFTIVFELAGLNSVAHVMNAVILITVLSCANSGMYVSSRMLCALANEGIAHKKLGMLHLEYIGRDLTNLI